jgi:hypothetical protein
MTQTMTAPVERTIVKKEEYAALYSDGTILIKGARACYPHLDKPYAGPQGQNQGDPRYTIQGLLPKTDAYKPSVFLIRDEINKLMQAAKIQALPPDRKFLRDGDLRPDKPEFVGNYVVSAAEKRQPALRSRGKDPRTGRALIVTPQEAANVFYGGCYVNILLRPWVQNNQFGKRVNANLLAVQFIKDGEAFGQGRISDDAIDDSFGVIEDDDSGYDDGIGGEDDL